MILFLEQKKKNWISSILLIRVELVKHEIHNFNTFVEFVESFFKISRKYALI